MSDPEHTKDLASVNAKIIAEGEVLPAVKMRDGTRVQTGTLATMLYNIGLYNAGARGEVEQELVLAVPTLIKVGLFDLFPAAEWVAGSNPGRVFVGRKAMEYLNTAGSSDAE